LVGDDAERNPVSVDIFPEEGQLLDLADFGATSEWIEIPSEMGYSSSQAAANGPISSRVFLRTGREYRASTRSSAR
jgi:hypothetical protein